MQDDYDIEEEKENNEIIDFKDKNVGGHFYSKYCC